MTHKWQNIGRTNRERQTDGPDYLSNYLIDPEIMNDKVDIGRYEIRNKQQRKYG